MLFFQIRFIQFLVLALLMSLSVHSRETQYIEFIRRNGVVTFKNPVGPAGETAPVIASHSEGHFFIATGEPANIIAGRQQKKDMEILRLPALLFENLRFIVNERQSRTAAFYPLRPMAGIEIAALHTLQKSQLENPLPDNLKMWGVLNPKTNKLMDIAIIADSLTTADTLAAIIKVASENAVGISTGYVDHLNEVDAAGEIMLSQSTVKITSQNENYVFFKNDEKSMVGSASSGAIIYNTANNQPHSVIVCASNVYLDKSQSQIVKRAFKLESIKHHQLIELTAPDIENFEPLPCEGHNGRGGGGT